jgi:Xaa-Pro aminopeptidase
VLDRSNTFYLSGFAGTFSILLIGRDAAYFLTDFRYIERAQKDVTGYKILRRKRNFERAVAQVARRKGWSRIGFEETIAYKELERFRKADKTLNFICDKEIIEDLRITKDASEIDSIQRAASICDGVLSEIRRYLRPGKSERQIEKKINALAEKLGGQSLAFPTIVASGPNSSMPHYGTADRILKKGDSVTIDLGVRINGYCSDITRTFFLGSAPREGRQIYEIVLKAQRIAIEHIKPDMPAAQIDRIARSQITQKGYGQFFGHGLGHGVGIDIHEPPYIKRGEETSIRPGMVFTVEPGIYIPGKLGVRIEDLVVATEDGCNVLTRTPKDFSDSVLRI